MLRISLLVSLVQDPGLGLPWWLRSVSSFPESRSSSERYHWCCRSFLHVTLEIASVCILGFGHESKVFQRCFSPDLNSNPGLEVENKLQSCYLALQHLIWEFEDGQYAMWKLDLPLRGQRDRSTKITIPFAVLRGAVSSASSYFY